VAFGELLLVGACRGAGMNWQYLACAGRHLRFIGQVP